MISFIQSINIFDIWNIDLEIKINIKISIYLLNYK